MESANQPVEFRVAEVDGKVEVTAWAGERAGVLVMSRAGPSQLIIEHTQTFPPFAGRGIGKRLVVTAAEWARANEQKLMPLCPFARQIFDRIPDLDDVRTGL
jgi:predicted GNAT family acetyltransferase